MPSQLSLKDLTEQILQQEAVLREGGGKTGQERQAKRGRMTARQRLTALIDPQTSIFELNLWAAYGMYQEWGEFPAAGVITAIGQVAGCSCMLIANDAT